MTGSSTMEVEVFSLGSGPGDETEETGAEWSGEGKCVTELLGMTVERGFSGPAPLRAKPTVSATVQDRLGGALLDLAISCSSFNFRASCSFWR